MRARLPTATLLALLAPAALLAVTHAQPASILGPVERIADGIDLYRLTDRSLLSPAGPIAVQALRIDPGKATIEIGIAGNRLPARETVPQIAARRGALAAVNAGFFGMGNGRPAGFLKHRGTVLGRARRPRGAVAFTEGPGGTRLLFDRVSVLRSKGKVEYRPRLGTSAKDWTRAADAVGGAGLLRLDGRDLTEWAEEQLATGFDTTRHPRTLIGVDAQDAIWLVTVDGRQPALSLGMSFRELQGLSRSLGLRSSLNLDGGGSTTMVARGNVVNHPSDPGGPRPVSDAILVFARKRKS